MVLVEVQKTTSLKGDNLCQNSLYIVVPNESLQKGKIIIKKLPKFAGNIFICQKGSP